MGKMKQMMQDKAELALQGMFMQVSNEDEVRFITNYILTVLDKEDVIKEDVYKEHIKQYDSCKDFVVTHIGVNKVCGMKCITYVIDTNDEETPKPFAEDYGTGTPAAFCYVLNLEAPEQCSEFGDCFFNYKKGFYYRAS